MTKVHRSLTVVNNSGEEIKLTGHEYICPICGAYDSGILKYKFKEFNVVTCSACETIHLAPMPTVNSLYNIYNTNYYKDEKGTHGYVDYAEHSTHIAKTYTRRFKRLQLISGKTLNFSNIHEIGCACGYGLEAAKNFFGCNVTGADISKDGVDACKARGLTVYQSDAQGLTPFPEGNKFDFIYLFDVIEHLPNITTFISWLNENIAPGGYVGLTTPDMDSFLQKTFGKHSPSYKIPQHVIYFTTKTLTKAFSPYFRYLGSEIDYQYMPFALLWSRIKSILNLSHQTLIGNNISILCPSGCSLYLFQKN